MVEAGSRTAAIREAARKDSSRAEAMLADLLRDLFDMQVEHLAIGRDSYSLNSLNGVFGSGGEDFFFKFHQEEDEADMCGEYYRAALLSDAGLPVDRPVRISRLPGEQILVYRRRTDPRFADVLRGLDEAPDPAAVERAIAAEAGLNDRLLAVACDSLHPITRAQSRAEPIHRLFHQRLTDPSTGAYPGGRLSRFYVGRRFVLPGLEVEWDEIAEACPVLDGIAYTRSLREMFDLAHDWLAPERLADAGGIIAHGDAHNANVWDRRGRDADSLELFDPAFAGEHVPSLLAEVKATFHNVFAHPLWLYEPDAAQTAFTASARLSGGRLHIETDWTPGEVRRRLLETKADRFWAPWIRHLASRGLLPGDWETVIRCALFLSPMELVMNLRAGACGGGHNPVSSAIGLHGCSDRRVAAGRGSGRHRDRVLRPSAPMTLGTGPRLARVRSFPSHRASRG